MSLTTPPWGYYTNLRPDELSAIRAVVPVAYLPWGALEWHGPHLPFGLEGIVAEAVSERVARHVGGVLLPTTWWPVTTLPHPDALSVHSEIMRRMWDALFQRLAQAAWRVVVVITGHYTPGHELVLMEAAEQALTRCNLLVLVLPPLALVDEEMLDYAGLWETSLLMALRPELVNLDALGKEPLSPKESGIIGRDPRGLASASMGTTTLELAVERIAHAVEQLLNEGNPASLQALYERRRTRYQSYREQYGQKSFEAAARAWWIDLVDGGSKPKE